MSRTYRILVLASVIGSLSIVASASAEKLVLVTGGGEGSAVAKSTEARIVAPFGVDFDRAGNMFICEVTGYRVRKVDASGRLSTVAGSGKKGFEGDGGPALSAAFNDPHNLTVGPDDNIYLADTNNHRVRKIDTRTGIVTTFAGTGQRAYGGDDGPADKATFNGVYCVTFDPAKKNLYIADLGNRRIRVIDMATKTVRTVAGNGTRGVPEDGGEAKSGPLQDPRAVAADSEGNVYILERNGHCLRAVDRDGRIRTVAGTGRAGYSGDDGEAREATLSGPKHLCVDRNGDVTIADTDNHVIRRYSPKTGKIDRVAGTGKQGAAGIGGDPRDAELHVPHGVTIGPDGLLYIADSNNNRVLKIEP